MKLNLGFADCHVPVLEKLRNGVEAIRKIEVDERALAVLQFVDDRGFLELAFEVGELPVIPDLPHTECLGLPIIPSVVEVQAAGIGALVGLLGGLGGLLVRCGGRFGLGHFPFKTVFLLLHLWAAG